MYCIIQFFQDLKFHNETKCVNLQYYFKKNYKKIRFYTNNETRNYI